MKSKTFNDDFIDEYVDKAPLFGQAFTTDTAEVNTYIVSLKSGNTVVEAKMVAHAAEKNG